MRIVLVNPASPPGLRDVGALPSRVATLFGWAAALRARELEVEIVQGWHRDDTVRLGEAAVHLVAGPYEGGLARWRAPGPLVRRTSGLSPDVVHLNGTHFGLLAARLRRDLPDAAIILQDHAGAPSGRPLWRLVERRCWRAVDAVLFTAREQADPWRDAGVLAPRTPVIEVMEGPVGWFEEPRPTGRGADLGQGPRGPRLCWVGHLIEQKDPVTVVRAVGRVLEQHPGSRLTMVFRRDDLLPELRRVLETDPALSGAAELRGTVDPTRMRAVHEASDVYLSGSRREGSGYALAEAMSRGVVPVVTDIPSFRAMTGRGRAGVLWPPGDVDACAAALGHVLSRPLDEQRRAVLRCARDLLSPEAIGTIAEAAYREALERRQRARDG